MPLIPTAWLIAGFVCLGAGLIITVVSLWFIAAHRLANALDERSVEESWNTHHDPMWG